MVIAAAMGFFAVAALLVLAAGTELVSKWRWAFDGAVTVQIPPSGDSAADTALAAALASALAESEQVARARALGPREIERLIEPWLGPMDGAEGIPLPRLVDIRLDPGVPVDIETLRRQVAAIAPNAVLDDHGRWVQGLGRLALTVENLAAVVLALVVATVIAAVGLAVRTAFALHRETVDILHLMGAEDGYIARLFAGLAFRRALVGGLIGLALALLLVLVAGEIGAGAGAVLPALSVGQAGWIAIVLTPLALAVVSWLVARMTARSALRRRV